jgi:hypothetical protein
MESILVPRAENVAAPAGDSYGPAATAMGLICALAGVEVTLAEVRSGKLEASELADAANGAPSLVGSEKDMRHALFSDNSTEYFGIESLWCC